MKNATSLRLASVHDFSRELISLLLFFQVLSLSAQFDTIAGPFSGIQGAVTNGEDLVAATISGFGLVEIMRYDVENLENEPELIFTNPFNTPVAALAISGDDLYVSTFGPALIDGGKIFRIENYASGSPQSSLYRSIPWLAAGLAVVDSTFYLARFSFSGGGLFTLDLTDPDAEPEVFVSNQNDPYNFLTLQGNELYFYLDDSPNIRRLSPNSSSPFGTSVVTGLNSPGGFAIDGDRIYVAEGNQNVNATSRIKVYNFPEGGNNPIEELADNTRLAIGSVVRIDGRTYLTEIPPETGGPGGYILRIQEELTNTQQPTIQRFAVAPNPATDQVTFTGLEPLSISIYDFTGRQLRTVVEPRGSIDLSALPTGQYTLLANLPDGTNALAKVVKK